jgi:hypothetical protein
MRLFEKLFRVKPLTDDALIEKLKTVDVAYRAHMRAQNFRTTVPDDYPPASPQLVEQTEQELGFALPPLLRRLYTEVANGGFGPGVVGLEGGHRDDDFPEYTLVGLYDNYRDYANYMIECEPEFDPKPWPERLVPIFGEGCNMILCIDCNDSEMPVIRYDANYGQWETRFIPVHPSLRSWLQSWVRSLK